MVALNLGSIVAYLNILADVLSSVAGTIIPPGAEPSRNAYIMGGCAGGTMQQQRGRAAPAGWLDTGVRCMSAVGLWQPYSCQDT